MSAAALSVLKPVATRAEKPVATRKRLAIGPCALMALSTLVLTACNSNKAVQSDPTAGQGGDRNSERDTDRSTERSPDRHASVPAIEPTVTVVAHGFAIISHAPASGTLAGVDLQPRAGSDIEWKILAVSGNAVGSPGESIRIRTRSDSRYGAALAVDEGADQTLHIDGADAGTPVMPVTDAHSDQSISRFDPPLPLGQAQLGADQRFEGSASMVIESMEKVGSERDRGTATRTVHFAANETIRTPLGELNCQRVEISFNAKLKFATASVQSTRWILPGVGAVAEEMRERIVILGLIPRTAKRVMVRTTPLPVHAQ